MSGNRMRLVLGSALSIALLVGTLTVINSAGAGSSCPAPSEPMSFAKPKYIDENRAGGEPSVDMLPNGTMLYGGHAGTTHFYSPAAPDPNTAAFLENYTGQVYYYWSKDNGKTWTFVPRHLPPNNTPLSGFSDPDFAIDKAGQVYISEINLLNVAVSKSTDGGKSYELQNFFAMDMTDRQWSEADEKDVLYLVGNAFAGGTVPSDPVGNTGHVMYKSTDGGQTFSQAIPDGGGLGDIQVDKSNGTVYEAHYEGSDLEMYAFRGARKDNFKPDVGKIATQVSMLSHWPAIDIDDHGNLYITWDESGTGGRPAGIYYSYSTNGGKTWAAPTRVDANRNTDIWPWLAVGDDGKVAVAWFGADKELPNQDAETPGDHGWRVYIAQTLNGLGCDTSNTPGFRVATATAEPFHTGTVCMGGTVCQAQLIDRRLGDYFSIDIDNQGMVWGVYSDTREGGAIALPAFVRQTAGPSFLGR